MVRDHRRVLPGLVKLDLEVCEPKFVLKEPLLLVELQQLVLDGLLGPWDSLQLSNPSFGICKLVGEKHGLFGEHLRHSGLRCA